MKKITLVTLFVLMMVGVVPAHAHAAWWNPLSWFKKTPSTSISVPAKSETRKITGSEKQLTVKLGDVLEAYGVKATVAEVAEDSRCPKGVQCIQAGTVRVRIAGKYGLLSKSIVFTLGQPQSYKGHSVVLSSVTPEKVAGKTINPGDYVFTFTHTAPGDQESVNDEQVNTVAQNNRIMYMGASSKMRALAELAKEKNGSYAGVCKDDAITTIFQSVKQNSGNVVCNDSAQSWAASIHIEANNYVCVDITGKTGDTHAGLQPGQTQCVFN